MARHRRTRLSPRSKAAPGQRLRCVNCGYEVAYAALDYELRCLRCLSSAWVLAEPFSGERVYREDSRPK